MSTTYTPNAKLGQPALGDTGWSTPLNANSTTLDGLAPVGGLCVTLHEVPSTSLNVAVAAGQYVQQDGSIGTFAGSSSQAITASATKVLYLDLTASGVSDGRRQLPEHRPRPPGDSRRRQLDHHVDHRQPPGIPGLRLDP